MKKRDRNPVVDLIKFFSAILIAYLHFNLIFDPSPDTSHFRSSYILVEVFLIITGFFTAKHFSKTKKTTKLDDSAKTAIAYTKKKFIPLLPYVLVGILIGVVANVVTYDTFSFRTIYDELIKIPMELFGFVFTKVEYNVFYSGQLWYLSALLLTLPIFIMLANSKQKNLRDLLMFIFVCIYYCDIWIPDGVHYIAIFRVFAGLCLGQLIFRFSESLSQKKLTKKAKIFLQLIETSCPIWFLLQIVNRGDILKPDLNRPTAIAVIVAFVLYFTILFSNQTYIKNFKSNRFTKFLGAISMPIFLIHQQIFGLIKRLDLNLSYNKLFVLCFALMSLASIAAFLIFSFHSSSTRKES